MPAGCFRKHSGSTLVPAEPAEHCGAMLSLHGAMELMQLLHGAMLFSALAPGSNCIAPAAGHTSACRGAPPAPWTVMGSP